MTSVVEKRLGALPVAVEFMRRLDVAGIVDGLCSGGASAHLTHGQVIEALMANRGFLIPLSSSAMPSRTSSTSSEDTPGSLLGSSAASASYAASCVVRCSSDSLCDVALRPPPHRAAGGGDGDGWERVATGEM